MPQSESLAGPLECAGLTALLISLDGLAEALGVSSTPEIESGVEPSSRRATALQSDADPIGGLAVELAELAHAGVVGFPGAREQGQELEIIGEGF